MEAGNGDDIEVGVPIMVTVEEEDDIAAFADFVVEAAAPEPVAEPEPAPVVEAAAPAPPAPAPVAAVPVAAAVEEVVVVAPEMEAMAAAVAPILSTGWGDFAKLNSPILKTLSKQQNDYVEKYGTTGQVPL